MSYTEHNATRTAGYSSLQSAGLRSYMVKVYNSMAIALGITGLVAFLVSQSSTMIQMLYGTPLHWVVAFAPILYVIVFSSKISDMSTQTAHYVFWLFAALMGLSMGSVFLVYTGTSIARAFFISASMFGAMALYGNTTNTDLTSIGTFLMMGVFGLIVASLINIFVQSSGMQFAISLLGVVIFTGLTAYDSQQIRNLYFNYGGGDVNSDAVLSKLSIMSALNLYFDFINIFVSLLRLTGQNRSGGE